MNEHGYIRVAAAIPSVRVADCKFNVDAIIELMRKAAERKARIVVFPELCVTAYTCGDLFLQPELLRTADRELRRIVEYSAEAPVTAIVGLPVAAGNAIYNCAAVVSQGEIVGVVPKSFIPNYSEFYEARWFESGMKAPCDEVTIAGQKAPFGVDRLFKLNGVGFGIEICEDLWAPVPPSLHKALGGAELLFNLSASPEVIGKHDYLVDLVRQQSARTSSAYIYVSAGFGESSTDLVFAGNGIVAENGATIACAERFDMGEQYIEADIDIEYLRTQRRRRNTYAADGCLPEYRVAEIRQDAPAADDINRRVDPMPFVPRDKADRRRRCEEIFAIQTHGLAKRLAHTGCRCAVIGISGGLDSTLALLVAVRTFDKLKLDRKGIIGITMPGFGTTDRTYNNAVTLIRELGITLREIPIEIGRAHV